MIEAQASWTCLRKIVLLAGLLLVGPERSIVDAWAPLCPHRLPGARKVSCQLLKEGGRREQSFSLHLTTSKGNTDDFTPPESENKRRIDVVNSVELPFSAEIAYQAYSDLTRQPSWSSWLHSVEYKDGDDDSDSAEESIWTMKVLGVKYSWTAVSTELIPPRVIGWKSTSGLKNFGRVEFQPISDYKTNMNLTMTFIAPRAVSAIFRRSKKLVNFVDEQMIRASLEEFRDIVLENDVQKLEQEKDSIIIEN